VNALLDKGADPNAKEPAWVRRRSCSLLNRSCDAIRALLKHGADANIHTTYVNLQGMRRDQAATRSATRC